MKKLNLFTFLTILLFSTSCADEQQMIQEEEEEALTETFRIPVHCPVGSVMENGVLKPGSPAEITAEEWAAAESTKADEKMYIPVVFHIFKNANNNLSYQGTINMSRIEKTLKWINNDNAGIKNTGSKQYFSMIHADRKKDAALMNMVFVLAKFDEDGNPIVKGKKYNGGTALGEGAVMSYPNSHAVNKAGPGNWSANNAVSKIGWDNNRYMNIYITDDLYANKKYYNSGVAWYPRKDMHKMNAGRIVYNGYYLPGGSGGYANYYKVNFCSIITHEIGHYFNLIHVFNQDHDTFEMKPCNKNVKDGGKYGDFVDDTPQMEVPNIYEPNAYTGHGKKNCLNETIDYGNVMNYGAYCNWTNGQVKRSRAAANGPYRKNLWTKENIKATTGLEIIGSSKTLDDAIKNLDDKL